MVQENSDFGMEDPDAYESDMKEIETYELPREIDTPDTNKPVSTITDAMEDTSDLTDMQFIASRMFPKHLGSPISNSLMVARVDPGVFNALMRILVKGEIMRCDPNKSINVHEAVAKNYTLMSIGLEGLGRIDYAEIGGAARAAKVNQERSQLGGLLGS